MHVLAFASAVAPARPEHPVNDVSQLYFKVLQLAEATQNFQVRGPFLLSLSRRHPGAPFLS